MSQPPNPNDDIPYAQVNPQQGQYSTQQYGQAPHPGQGKPPEQNVMGTTGFIVSLVSLFLCGIPSIIGIIISAFGLKKEPKSLAIAGLILGILGVLECILFVTFALAAYSAAQQAGVAFQAIIDKVKVEQKAMEVFEKWEKDGTVPNQEDGNAIVAGTTDQSKQPLSYETDGESFTIRSIGPDGVANTGDDVTAGPYDDISEYETLKESAGEFEDFDPFE